MLAAVAVAVAIAVLVAVVVVVAWFTPREGGWLLGLLLELLLVGLADEFPRNCPDYS